MHAEVFMNKRWMAAVFAVAALTLTSCSPSNDSTSNTAGVPSEGGGNGGDAGQGELEVGLSSLFIGAAPLLLAQEKGFYGDAPIHVSVAGDSSTQNQPLLRAGKFNVISSTVDNTLADVAQDSSNYAKIISLLDVDHGYAGILSGPGINTLADLRGKTVGYDVGTQEFLLIEALKTVGLTAKDVQQVPLAGPEAGAAFIAGKVDAAVTWEPYITQALNSKNDAHKLFTTADYPTPLITDVLTATKDVIDHRPQLLVTLLKGYQKALDYIKNDPDHAIPELAKLVNIPDDEARANLDKLSFYTVEQNKTFFGTDAAPGGIDQLVNDTNDYLKSTGKAVRSVSPSELLDRTIVDQAAS
jgi:NitT/TauT family transport system substrate-binding protein